MKFQGSLDIGPTWSVINTIVVLTLEWPNLAL